MLQNSTNKKYKQRRNKKTLVCRYLNKTSLNSLDIISIIVSAKDIIPASLSVNVLKFSFSGTVMLFLSVYVNVYHEKF